MQEDKSFFEKYVEMLSGYRWEAQRGLFQIRNQKYVVNAIPILYTRWRKKQLVSDIEEQGVDVAYRYADMSESEVFQIPVKELEKDDFKIPTDVIVGIGFNKKIREIFRFLIKSQFARFMVEERMEYKFGWNANQYFWNEGSGNFQGFISEDTYKQTVAFANLVSTNELIAEIALAAMQGPLNDLLNSAGIHHNYVTYVVGETGVGKTEIVKRLCNYLPQIKVFLALGSDRKQLRKQMSELKDITLILDDFCKSDSTRVHEKNLQVLSEIIQNASDSGQALFNDIGDIQYNQNLHLIITGESMIKNFSTFNRCFVIDMNEKLSDNEWSMLLHFSNNQGMYIFMRGFMKWIEKNRLEIIERMKADYQFYYKHSKKNLVFQVPGIERIRNTVAVRLTVQKCLLDYFAEVRSDKILLNDVKNVIWNSIWAKGRAMCEQMMSIKNEKNRQIYLQVLAEIISQLGNGAWLAKDEDEYLQYANIKGKAGVCIGICLHEGYWSLDSKKMCELVAEKLNVESVATKSISCELKHYALAYVDSEGKMSCRWCSRKRMHHIRVRELVELIYPDWYLGISIERRVNECLIV